MKRIYSILLYPITVSAACAIGLDDVYTNTDVYATLSDYDVDAIAKKPDSGGDSGGSGDVVSVPEHQLGLPDGNYKSTPGMLTSGQGTSQDTANIIDNLKAALDDDENPLDLMHWYVAPLKENEKVHYCNPNAFRCDYDGHPGQGGEKHRVAAAMVVWLPQDARHINVSFASQSAGLSLSIYTYDYLTDTMLLHYSENNIFSNPHAPGDVVTFNQKITSQSTVGAFTGNYLILMFNTSESEKTWLDINGLGVSYAPVDVTDDFDINPHNDDVGYNIIAYDDDWPIAPEPATTTLSLLALAGLAARRRRK